MATAAVLLLVLATVWATPHVSGDTFMALAGGRDVFEGKLARPDDWSFATPDKVWLNQNWGFDALAWGSMRMAGETGLLVLKALFIAAIAGAIAAAARTRGTSWPTTLLVVAAVLAGARWRFDVRANLATFVLAVLLIVVIYHSRARSQLIWLAVPTMVAWANAHGGFMLGFALLGLWLVATGSAAFRVGGLRLAAARSWAVAGALVASLTLAAATSPFGIENLTPPFTIANSPEWRTVQEWKPVTFTALRGPTHAWELLLLLAVIVVAVVVRLRTSRSARPDREVTATTLDALTLFDGGLVLLMSAMAFSANRFVPLALFVLAPLAAWLLDDLLSPEKTWFPTATCALALAIPVVPFTTWAASRYSAGNPRFTDETVFQRMVVSDRMPYGAANFLNDNAVAGRVFNQWEWEGFLRLGRPQSKLFVGERAAQIYSLELVHTYHEVIRSPQPASILASLEVSVVVVPAESEFIKFVGNLIFTPGAHWATVFYDGRALVLADLSMAATRALSERVAAGQARFRNADVAALSRALCRIAPALGTGGPSAVDELLAASHVFPTEGGPWFVLFAALAGEVQPQVLVRSLETQDALLTAESKASGRLGRLLARLSIAQVLGTAYRSVGQPSQAAGWNARAQDLWAQVQAVLADS